MQLQRHTDRSIVVVTHTAVRNMSVCAAVSLLCRKILSFDDTEVPGMYIYTWQNDIIQHAHSCTAPWLSTICITWCRLVSPAGTAAWQTHIYTHDINEPRATAAGLAYSCRVLRTGTRTRAVPHETHCCTPMRYNRSSHIPPWYDIYYTSITPEITPRFPGTAVLPLLLLLL